MASRESVIAKLVDNETAKISTMTFSGMSSDVTIQNLNAFLNKYKAVYDDDKTLKVVDYRPSVEEIRLYPTI